MGRLWLSLPNHLEFWQINQSELHGESQDRVPETNGEECHADPEDNVKAMLNRLTEKLIGRKLCYGGVKASHRVVFVESTVSKIPGGVDQSLQVEEDHLRSFSVSKGHEGRGTALFTCGKELLCQQMSRRCQAHHA